MWAEDSTAFPYVSYCVENGILDGYGDCFRPSAAIRFGDFCRALLNVLNIEPGDNAVATARDINLFNNVPNLPHTNGYITGKIALPIIVNAMYAHSPRIYMQSSQKSDTIAAGNFYAAKRPYLVNVVYVPNSTEPKHTLDIYYPQSAMPQNGWPVIISLHGGGFTRGSKLGNKLNAYAFSALKHGYAVVCINYRLVQTAKVPAQIADAKAAVRYLRTNAAKLGLNADKFVAMGYSSGANLAALLAASADNARFADYLQALDIAQGSDKVAAAVAFYGHYDQNTSYAQYAWLTGAENADYNAKYAIYKSQRAAFNAAYDLPYEDDPDWISPHYDKPLRQAQNLVALMNPATFANAGNAPLLLLHGEMDSTVNFLQSVDLAEALEEANARVTLVLVPKAEHGADFHEIYGMEHVFRWLALNLR